MTQPHETNGAAALPERGVTLVLGGGGARGLAHLGVLKVLEEDAIPVTAIVGTSAGAVMGAAWLQRGDAVATIDHVLGFLRSPQFARLGLSHPRHDGARPKPMFARILTGWRRHVAMHLLFRRPALFHQRRLEVLVHAAVKPGGFERLRRPLLVVALDLKTGEEVILERGDLRAALTASASVAGFFPPVEIDGRVLFDAGLADNLPVDVARARCGRPIVAVNLSREVDERVDFGTGIEMLLRSEELGSRYNTRLRAARADVQVAPRLGGRYWLDFSRPETIIAAGEAAAREQMPAIRAALAAAEPPRPPAAAAPIDPERRGG
jgi:NTE family protein